MLDISVTLPESVGEFVEREVARGGFATPSAYIEELVRNAQKQQADERLETLLLDGLGSGPMVEVTPDLWHRKHAEFLARHGAAAE